MYGLLAGQVGVMKAYLAEVPLYQDFEIVFNSTYSKYYAWLSSLIDNFDLVFWHKIPYCNSIKALLMAIKMQEEADVKVTTVGAGSVKSHSTYENISINHNRLSK